MARAVRPSLFLTTFPPAEESLALSAPPSAHRCSRRAAQPRLRAAGRGRLRLGGWARPLRGPEGHPPVRAAGRVPGEDHQQRRGAPSRAALSAACRAALPPPRARRAAEEERDHGTIPRLRDTAARKSILRNLPVSSAAASLSRPPGRQEISQIADRLGIRPREDVSAAALRLYKLAVQRNFTRGRRTAQARAQPPLPLPAPASPPFPPSAPPARRPSTLLISPPEHLQVAAACLYVVCRQDSRPYMLIDFSDVLQARERPRRAASPPFPSLPPRANATISRARWPPRRAPRLEKRQD